MAALPGGDAMRDKQRSAALAPRSSGSQLSGKGIAFNFILRTTRRNWLRIPAEAGHRSGAVEQRARDYGIGLAVFGPLV
jgi:hypothetical protein